MSRSPRLKQGEDDSHDHDQDHHDGGDAEDEKIAVLSHRLAFLPGGGLAWFDMLIGELESVEDIPGAYRFGSDQFEADPALAHR